MIRTLALATTLTALAATAHARPATEEEEALITSRMEAIIAATEAREFATIVAEMPAPLVAQLAEQADVTPDEFSAMIQQQMEIVFAEIEEMDMRFETAALDIQGCDDGAETCMPHTFVPQTTTLTLTDGTMIVMDGSTFAFSDGETWHFLNTDPNLEILAEFYPALEGIEFPAADIRLGN